MKIGFFGDSFCADIQSQSGTYLQLLANHYDAEIVNLGTGGSSIWDVLLLQIDPFIKNNNIPDICVFVWTEPGRLFHRVLRHLNIGSAVSDNWRSPLNDHEIIYKAAKDYYLHLHDPELDHYRYAAALHYFDTVVLPTFPKNTKIVHLWSFGHVHQWYDKNSFLPEHDNCCHVQPEQLLYFHTWKNGFEIRPSLTSIIISCECTLKEMMGSAQANHIPFGKQFDPINSLIFNRIKDAIDQQ